MRVKHTMSAKGRRRHSGPVVILCLAAAALTAGCQARGAPAASILELSPRRPGPYVSLIATAGSLYAVSSEIESQSILVTEIPFAAAGGGTAQPRIVFMDKIDRGPAPSAGFGELTACAAGEVPWVLYLDNASEDTKVLKLISRPKKDWIVDTLEPAGLPVALCAASEGSAPSSASASIPAAPLRVFWAASGQLLQKTGAGEPVPEAAPFSSAGPGCPAGSGFTVYDLSSRSLLHVQAESYGTFVRPIPGGGQVNAAALKADGMLAALSYDPLTRRIVLLEETGEDAVKKTLVTQGTDTRSLALVRCTSGYLILYDSMEGGTGAHTLFLLYPGRSGYDREALLSSREPISSLGIAARQDTLYVLCAGEKLDLVTVRLVGVSSG